MASLDCNRIIGMATRYLLLMYMVEFQRFLEDKKIHPKKAVIAKFDYEVMLN